MRKRLPRGLQSVGQVTRPAKARWGDLWTAILDFLTTPKLWWMD